MVSVISTCTALVQSLHNTPHYSKDLDNLKHDHVAAPNIFTMKILQSNYRKMTIKFLCKTFLLKHEMPKTQSIPTDPLERDCIIFILILVDFNIMAGLFCLCDGHSDLD